MIQRNLRIVVRLCGIFSALIFMFIFVKIAGVDAYGRFAFIFALANVVALFAVFGASTLILKQSAELSELWDKKKNLDSRRLDSNVYNVYLYSLFWIVVVNMVVFLFCWPIVNIVWSGESLMGVWKECFAMSFCLSFLNLIATIHRVLHGVVSYFWHREILFYGAPICVLLFLSVVGYKGDLVFFVIASMSIATGLSFLSAGYVPSYRPTVLGLFLHLRSAHLFCWSGLVGVLAGNLDVFLGKIVLSDSALGVYAILKKMALTTMLPQNLANVECSLKISKIIHDSDKVSEELSVFCALNAQRVVRQTIAFMFLFLLCVLASRILPNQLFGFTVSYGAFYGLDIYILFAAVLVNVFFGVNLMVASLLGAELVVLLARFVSILLALTVFWLSSAAIQAHLPAVTFVIVMTITNVFVSVYLYLNRKVTTLAPLHPIKG